jgi:hypothetical protein
VVPWLLVISASELTCTVHLETITVFQLVPGTFGTGSTNFKILNSLSLFKILIVVSELV